MSELVMSKLEISSFANKKWLADFRAQQLKEFLQKGFPTRKDELWKYTEVKESSLPMNKGMVRELFSEEKLSEMSDILFVFINGHFSEKLSNIKNLPSSVTLCTMTQALNLQEDRIKPYLLREFDHKRFPFAKLNSAMMLDGMFLDIPKNVIISSPIHLVFIQTEQNDFMINSRNIIVADKQSQATILENHFSINARNYFTNPVTEIYAGENAHIHYYKIQEDDLTATHIANIFIEQEQNSFVKTFSFSKGSRLAREDLSVWQKAPNVETYMHGLYVLNHDQQHVDHHIHVDHLADHGVSSMAYKGILDQQSKVVFNGKVYVHPHTKHINAHQENHNLLLSDKAEVNAKPELEIYAEDVKCTHGATIGQLDREALFYLTSRGIEKNEANTLLIHAFLDEVYSKIEDLTMRQYIQNRMNGHDE